VWSMRKKGNNMQARQQTHCVKQFYKMRRGIWGAK
jgi:hypothetical protein